MRGDNLAMSRIYRYKYGEFPACDVTRRHNFSLKIYPDVPPNSDCYHIASLEVFFRIMTCVMTISDKCIDDFLFVMSRLVTVSPISNIYWAFPVCS